MISPTRQSAFRRAAMLHLLFISAMGWMIHRSPTVGTVTLFSYVLVAAGIVEGAILIGWRLVQLPKSQALEFLLTSPVHPHRLFMAEAFVGISRFALVTLAGLPVLLTLLFSENILPIDVLLWLCLPFLTGLIAAFGLIAWTYEPIKVRRIGQIFALLGILTYLIVGVLAGERLRVWLLALPEDTAELLFRIFYGFHAYNPFGIAQYWFDPNHDWAIAFERAYYALTGGTLMLLLLFLRAAFRMKGHFHDRHYKPISSDREAETQAVGEAPLSWWAVRRVMEYSGRSNLWLAGGFSILYSAYLIAADNWPAWMGQLVFQIFEKMGGAPVLITGMILLSAVPAAFQYGLWDANAQDRCRRLELLLLTELNPLDYWKAALAAAWRRGRGYLFIALMLWTAMLISGRATFSQVLASLVAAGILWGFTFALGFRAFSRGMQANGLGSLLTLGFPLLTAAAFRLDLPWLANIFPPGAVYLPLVESPRWWWSIGPILTAGATIWCAQRALARCDSELRLWFDQNQGRKALT